MKVKFLLLVCMMCVGLTACSSTTSNEDGGYTDEEINQILDRAHDRSEKQEIDVNINEDDGVKEYCDYTDCVGE